MQKNFENIFQNLVMEIVEKMELIENDLPIYPFAMLLKGDDRQGTPTPSINIRIKK